MKLSREVRRKKMNVAKLTSLAGPEEFVRFGAPEHVELGGALIDGSANRQRHQHQTDAVLLIPIVEAVLVEVKGAVIKKAVHDSGRHAVQAQDVHPQPAASEKAPRHFVVKCAERRGAKRRPLRVEPVGVIVRQPFERRTAVRVAADLLEADCELLLERAKTSPDIGAV